MMVLYNALCGVGIIFLVLAIISNSLSHYKRRKGLHSSGDWHADWAKSESMIAAACFIGAFVALFGS